MDESESQFAVPLKVIFSDITTDFDSGDEEGNNPDDPSPPPSHAEAKEAASETLPIMLLLHRNWTILTKQQLPSSHKQLVWLVILIMEH